MVNAKILRKGLHFCSSFGSLATGGLSPDPLGVDATPPALTYGLSDLAAGIVFTASNGRDAIIRSIYLGATGTTVYPEIQIRIHNTGTIVASFKQPEDAGATFTFGPEGFLVPGGFQVVLPGAPVARTFTIAYEVV